MVSKKSVALLAAILVLVVVLYYLASSNPLIKSIIPTFSQSGPSSAPHVNSSSNSSKGAGSVSQQSNAKYRTAQLIGSYQNETLTISNNTVVNITGSYNRITLYSSNIAQSYIYVIGNYNFVNITGGSVNIGGYGNYDSVFANSTGLNGTIIGNNNQISRGR